MKHVQNAICPVCGRAAKFNGVRIANHGFKRGLQNSYGCPGSKWFLCEREGKIHAFRTCEEWVEFTQDDHHKFLEGL